jgi:hypothetical protein
VNLSENITDVTTVTATDVDVPAQPLTLSIAGGADAARFTINPTSGELRFTESPDFESPVDADSDGTYQVVVSVSDGLVSTTQAISVVVGNVNEAPTGISPGQVTVSEIVDSGSQLATLTAIDQDAGESFTFDLVTDNAGLFQLNNASGALGLRTDAVLDYETQVRHELTVRVTDSAGQTYDQVVIIVVTDDWTDTDLNPSTGSDPQDEPSEVAPPLGVDTQPEIQVGTTQESETTIADLPQTEATNSLTGELVAIPVDVRQISIEPIEIATTKARRFVQSEPLELTLSFESLVPASEISEFINDFRPLASRQVVVSFGDSERDQLEEQTPPTLFELATDPVRIASSVLSVGAVWWLTRSGGLIATMLMGIPTWRHLDLLPVVSKSFGNEPTPNKESSLPETRPEELFSETVIDAMFDSQSVTRGRP